MIWRRNWKHLEAQARINKKLFSENERCGTVGFLCSRAFSPPGYQYISPEIDD